MLSPDALFRHFADFFAAAAFIFTPPLYYLYHEMPQQPRHAPAIRHAAEPTPRRFSRFFAGCQLLSPAPPDTLIRFDALMVATTLPRFHAAIAAMMLMTPLLRTLFALMPLMRANMPCHTPLRYACRAFSPFRLPTPRRFAS